MGIIIAISNEKGGVGKSTLATNLAVIQAKNKRVRLIDHDTSHVSLNFFTRRDYLQKKTEVNVVVPADYAEMEAALTDNDYEVTIVDIGGFTDEMAVAALVYSDLVVVPTNTSSHDMDGNIQFMDTISDIISKGAELRVVFVPNKVSPQKGIKRVWNELHYVTAAGYKLVGRLNYYEAYSSAHSKGCSIEEHSAASNAAKQMIELSDLLMQEL